MVELVNSWPKQGVASTFIGASYRTMLGVIGALAIPVRHVSPPKWKKALGLNSDAETSRARAIETWPCHRELFARKRDHNRAEAALLGLYGLKASDPMLARPSLTEQVADSWHSFLRWKTRARPSIAIRVGVGWAVWDSPPVIAAAISQFTAGLGKRTAKTLAKALLFVASPPAPDYRERSSLLCRRLLRATSRA
jgi:hypothetical protein